MIGNTSPAAPGFRVTQDGSPGDRPMARIVTGDLIGVPHRGVPSARVTRAYLDGPYRVLWWDVDGRDVAGIICGDLDDLVPFMGHPSTGPLTLAEQIARKQDEVTRLDLAYQELYRGFRQWHEWRPAETWDDLLTDAERQALAESEALTEYEAAVTELAGLRLLAAGGMAA